MKKSKPDPFFYVFLTVLAAALISYEWLLP